jgi:hypothetical protein
MFDGESEETSDVDVHAGVDRRTEAVVSGVHALQVDVEDHNDKSRGEPSPNPFSGLPSESRIGDDIVKAAAGRVCGDCVHNAGGVCVEHEIDIWYSNAVACAKWETKPNGTSDRSRSR